IPQLNLEKIKKAWALLPWTEMGCDYTAFLNSLGGSFLAACAADTLLAAPVVENSFHYGDCIATFCFASLSHEEMRITYLIRLLSGFI
ncbi:hypothetical protein ACJX0J_037633, partial [Zea mays]